MVTPISFKRLAMQIEANKICNRTIAANIITEITVTASALYEISSAMPFLIIMHERVEINSKRTIQRRHLLTWSYRQLLQSDEKYKLPLLQMITLHRLIMHPWFRSLKFDYCQGVKQHLPYVLNYKLHIHIYTEQFIKKI